MDVYKREQFEEFAKILQEVKYYLDGVDDVDDVSPYTVLEHVSNRVARLFTVKGIGFDRTVFINWTRGIYKDKLK